MQKNAENTAEKIICPAGVKQVLKLGKQFKLFLKVWYLRDKDTDTSLLNL